VVSNNQSLISYQLNDLLSIHQSFDHILKAALIYHQLYKKKDLDG
jgi:hypothetical protein